MEIHQRLQSARKQAGYGRAVHAARALGVNPQTYSGHENGNRRFGRDAAIRYARAFGVGLEWLLTGTGPRADRVASEPAIGAPAGGGYDPDIFSQAVAMVDEFKLDMGFKFVSTPDYLQLIETFYEQVRRERARAS